MKTIITFAVGVIAPLLWQPITLLMFNEIQNGEDPINYYGPIVLGLIVGFVVAIFIKSEKGIPKLRLLWLMPLLFLGSNLFGAKGFCVADCSDCPYGSVKTLLIASLLSIAAYSIFTTITILWKRGKILQEYK